MYKKEKWKRKKIRYRRSNSLSLSFEKSGYATAKLITAHMCILDWPCRNLYAGF